MDKGGRRDAQDRVQITRVPSWWRANQLCKSERSPAHCSRPSSTVQCHGIACPFAGCKGSCLLSWCARVYSVLHLSVVRAH